MSCTWQQTTLGEVCSLRGGSAFSKDLQGRESGDLPFIKVSDFEHPENSYRIASANNWVTIEDAKSMKAKPHPSGATVFAKIGIALLSNRRRLLIRDTLVDNNLMSATPRDGFDGQFLFYLLRTLDFGSHAGGSALPYLTAKDLNAIAIEVPPPEAQRAIAGVLGALDDKIEQNRRTARALERLARAIFRAWFVDFEPVKAKAGGATAFPSMPRPVFDALPTRFVHSPIGPVPEGWAVKPIATIATFLNGLALQKYPPRGDGEDLRVIKIAELRKGSAEGADWASSDVPEQYVINDGDLLFSWSGTLEAEFWFGGKGALNQHLFKVTSSQFPSWFCFHWIRQHLPWFRAIAASKATTMGHIKRGHLQETQVVVPPNQVLREAQEVMGSIRDLFAQLMVESRRLAGMRDALLPKLLSGQVRVRVDSGANGEP